jgi:undecaprenyl-diphosphatase
MLWSNPVSVSRLGCDAVRSSVQVIRDHSNSSLKHQNWRTARLLPGVAIVLVFGWLVGIVQRGRTQPFDEAVRDTVHRLSTRQLTAGMELVTQLGAPVSVITLSVIIAWRLAQTGRRRPAIAVVLATLGGDAVSELLKIVFHRPRPESFFGYTEPVSYSMPSGHALCSFVLYSLLAIMVTARIRPPAGKAMVWTAAVLVIALIGFSRVYLGVHYPSDVAAGWLLGLIVVIVVTVPIQS